MIVGTLRLELSAISVKFSRRAPGFVPNGASRRSCSMQARKRHAGAPTEPCQTLTSNNVALFTAGSLCRECRVLMALARSSLCTGRQAHLRDRPPDQPRTGWCGRSQEPVASGSRHESVERDSEGQAGEPAAQRSARRANHAQGGTRDARRRLTRGVQEVLR